MSSEGRRNFAEYAALRNYYRGRGVWTGHLDTHDHGKGRSKLKTVKGPGTLVDTGEMPYDIKKYKYKSHVERLFYSFGRDLH